MAFPFIYEANFETGDNSEWDSETDTASQLSVEHYKTLAKLPFVNSVPYSGAYAARIKLTGGTADAFFVEGDVDYALNAAGAVRFTICFLNNFTATANDTFAILELQGAANAVQLSIGAKITASTGEIQIGIGNTAPTAFGPAIKRGVWYTVEATFDIDAGGGNDGSADLYITAENQDTGDSLGTLSSLDQVAVERAVLGIQDQLATTTGDILIGDFTADDARLYPRDRFPKSPEITKSGHIFIGRGYVDSATILSENADDSVDFFDTDNGNTNQVRKIELENGANLSASGPFFFNKGCYVSMAGASNPRAQAYFSDNDKNEVGVFGPVQSIQNYKALGR